MNIKIVLFAISAASFFCSNADLGSEIKQLKLKVDPVKSRKRYLKHRIGLAKEAVRNKLDSKYSLFDPVLSVVIPCYNRHKVVKEAIDSVLSQKGINNVELICVDDCSTDGTLQVLQEYEKNYDNVFVYRHEKNKGGSAARNTAIVHARGRYIFNLDSDDFLAENTLSSVLQVALERGSSVVYPGHAKVFSHGNKAKTRKKYMSDSRAESFSLENWQDFHKGWLTSVVCKLFTKESWLKVGGFVEEDGHDAIAFSLAQLLYGYRFDIAYDTFYNHRVWFDGSSKYRVEVKTNTINLCPYLTLLGHLEVLAPQGLRFISRKKSNIINNVGSLRLFSSEKLKLLFGARVAKSNKNYSLAAELYERAIGLGVDHVKVKLELAKCLYKIGVYDKSFQLVSESKDFTS